MPTSADSTFELPHWLDAAARSFPDRLALAFDDQRWSYAGLHVVASAAAARIADSSSRRYERIGILSANRPGWVFAAHAATMLGVPFVPLNWRQSTDEIAWQVRDAQITCLVVDDGRLDAASAIGKRDSVAILRVEDLESTEVRTDARPGPSRIDLRDDAAMLYTSGTTGRPKGARITYGNLWFSAVGSALYLGHARDDVWLAALPLFHIGGLSILFRAVIGGIPVMLHDRFVAGTVLQAIDNGATLVSVVPTMLQRLLDECGESPWPASLRCLLVGGSATPSELVEASLRVGIPIAPTYGLTEGSTQITTLLPSDVSRKPASSGLPLPGTEVRIMTPTRSTSVGEIGDIEFRGPTRFAGYLGEYAVSADDDGDDWFQTGDIGYLDSEGYLFVLDRRADLIVSGGENIYPAEIERVLREHPLVADAVVVGVPDEEWGARPVAAVVWMGDPAAAHGVLLQHCAGRMANFKIPDRIVVMEALPRSASGKMLRRQVRDAIREPGTKGS